MVINIYKFLFSISAAAASLFSINAFGSGLWSLVFVGISIVVLLSIFIDKINALSVVLARISGVLSMLALLLLLIAGTTGGSFNLSGSNEVFGVLLFILSIFGLSAFFWEIKKQNSEADS